MAKQKPKSKPKKTKKEPVALPPLPSGIVKGQCLVCNGTEEVCAYCGEVEEACACDEYAPTTCPNCAESSPAQSTKETLLSVDSQEFNTILAALRYYQRQGMAEPENRPDWLHDIATNADTDISLDDKGIDELCERINI